MFEYLNIDLKNEGDILGSMYGFQLYVAFMLLAFNCQHLGKHFDFTNLLELHDTIV
jgi:hypothetical protein